MGMPMLQSHNFLHVTQFDQECPNEPCTNAYFNCQALITHSANGYNYNSNLQVDYR
jgi:hypothetical protein